MISEGEKKRIMGGEDACVCVSPEYFSEGDYTAWQSQYPEADNMDAEEFQAFLVEKMREKYDTIVLHTDGCVYGNRGGVCFDISYHDFNEVEMFIELAEKFGIGEIQFQ